MRFGVVCFLAYCSHYREDGKVKKRTLANLSALPADQIEAIRGILRGEKLVPVTNLFKAVSSAQHGNVDAVLKAYVQTHKKAS